MVKQTVGTGTLKKEHIALIMAFRRINKSPDLKPIKEWIEKKYDDKMVPSGAITLERLAGRRDVIMEIRKMVYNEVQDDLFK